MAGRSSRGRVGEPAAPAKPVKIVFGADEVCPYCKGKGHVPGKKETCGACGGTGIYRKEKHEGS